MTAAQGSNPAATPYVDMNWTSWESTRMTMIKHESMFRHQIKELHRLHKKQKAVIEEVKATLRGQSNEQVESSVKKPAIDLDDEKVKPNELVKVEVQDNRGTNAPVTPKPVKSFMAGAELEDQATSSPLVWFANILTSIKPGSDLALLQKRALLDEQKARATALASRRQKKRKRQMPRHPADCPIPKKKRTPRYCILGWGTIKNGRRSKRVPDEDPTYTFLRGALLCRWR